jgi:hypothetical protein
MANPEHLEILKQGMTVWNEWRTKYPNVIPGLAGADLINAELKGMNLSRANLRGANLEAANLGLLPTGNRRYQRTNLNKADLSHTDLTFANLSVADLRYTNLEYANFNYTNLRAANLTGASLKHADIRNVDFTQALLEGTDFEHATLGSVNFADTSLGEALGLDTVGHIGQTYLDLDIIYHSGDKLPESFLVGCGLPDALITYLPSLLGAQQAIQFYSCFISYSTKDEDFARRLHSRMRAEHLRVWFAPEDIRAGQKLHEQIDRAIQVHDRLLLILSENSMQSEWVTTEIRRARRTEIEERRRKLFPITVVDFEKVRGWKCFDADSGKDLAVEVREYYIPDFSNWKDHDAFEAAFNRLLRDLRAEENIP